GPPLSNFATLAHVPDAIWPAHWLVPYTYTASATVWDVFGLSNDLWANHQRIRQYNGGHNETWGGVELNIDSNVIDGIVAVGGKTYLYLPTILRTTPVMTYIE
ncbi:MAG: glycoside hydrolase domain-containing protein, partial [Chloroflexota bacterium]